MNGLLKIKIFYKEHKTTILVHTLCWFLYILYFCWAIIMLNPDGNIHLLGVAIRFAGFINIFYVTSFLVLPNLIEKKFFFYAFYYLLISLLFAQVCYYLVVYIYKTEDLSYIQNPISFFLVNFYEFIQFIVAGAAYWFYRYSNRQKLEKLRFQEQFHKAEMSFLRVQINQHFLYNALSMFYANALPYSERLSSSILALSDILRYSVAKEFDAFVMLEEELQHINLFVEINQYRFSDKLKMKIEVEGDVDHCRIPYFILMTLIENAFKHGDLQNDYLYFSVKVEEGIMYARTKNKKSYLNRNSTKVGLDNMKKRLEILVPNRFIFNIFDQEMYFITELQIHHY